MKPKLTADEIMDVLQQEYSYWRQYDNDLSIAAIGALSNVIACAVGAKVVGMTVQEPNPVSQNLGSLEMHEGMTSKELARELNKAMWMIADKEKELEGAKRGCADNAALVSSVRSYLMKIDDLEKRLKFKTDSAKAWEEDSTEARRQLEEVKAENTKLREGCSFIAACLDNGSAASPNASVEFLTDSLAREVKAYVSILRLERDEARRELTTLKSFMKPTVKSFIKPTSVMEEGI